MSSIHFTISTVLALVALSGLLGLNSVSAAPPICDDPAAVPAEWAAIYSSELISNIGFDSNYVFVSGEGMLGRRRLNASEQLTKFISYGASSERISLLDRRVYAAEVPGKVVHVLDYDLNELAILFTAEPSLAPGGMVGQSGPIAVHPETGDLYVVSSGYYYDEGEPPTATWVSRIQRFHSNGSFDGLVIDNQLDLSPDDPGFEQSNPPMPACGAWHYPERLWVDAQGNVHLRDRVNAAGERIVIHKFAVSGSSGSCSEVWDATNKAVGIDRDGYVYEGVGNVISKFNPSRTELLYSAPMPSPFPIRSILEAPHTTDFILVSALTGDESEPVVTHILGPRIEPLAIIGQDWQSTSVPYRLRTDNAQLLAECDENKVVMEGVVADGVSPLLMRWKVPGPGMIRWELDDPLYTEAQSLLGTLASLDAMAVDTLTIETAVKKVDGEYFAFAVYSAPKNFDRLEVPSDNSAADRTVRVYARYFPTGTSNPSLSVFRALRVERPPVLFMHGLWSNPRSWANFPSIIGDSRWRTFQLDYGDEHGQGLAHHRQQDTVGNAIDNTRNKVGEFVVKAQVDVVMHSMGGLLVRDYADNAAYESQANYGHGDFHKLLFLDTPHEGSPLADMMLQIRDIIGNPLVPSFTAIGMARRANAVFTVIAIAISRGTSPEQIIGKAIDDLKTDSPEIAALQELAVDARTRW